MVQDSDIVVSAPGNYAGAPVLAAGGPRRFLAAYNAINPAISTGTLRVQARTLTFNTAPVAAGQAVTTTKDNSVAVILTGSDVDGDPLSYAVVTPPANGVLSGTAPNLLYTPQHNFYGSDIFTFVVNDGLVSSAPATVSLTINKR